MMETHVTRRRLVAGTALTLGSAIFVGRADVAAQATPVITATPVSPGGRDPYAYLGDLPTFTVTSTDVSDGQEMDVAQRSSISGGAGEDVSPQLAWSGQPDGVMSYIVSMYDPDAPTPSGFWHWAVFNIPADTTELPTGAGQANSTMLPEGSVTLPNDARLAQYTGAAPPPGPTHRYFIAVLALDVPSLDVQEDATPALLYANAFPSILGYGLLVPVATTPG